MDADADDDGDDENDNEVKQPPSDSTLNLIDEIQAHYKGGENAGKGTTTEELVVDLKQMGDDLETRELEKKCELWGFFQKTEGDLEDYLKETGELPEHLMKNQIFYHQWKGKKMIDIIFNHYDNECPNASGKFTESFVLKEYGEYLMGKEKFKIDQLCFIAKEQFKKKEKELYY